MRSLDRFRGCLIGGAAGDALGYPVEFLRWGAIARRYGEAGIRNYDLTGGRAEISDDTQMTLFTANGLLLAETRRRWRGEAMAASQGIWLCYRDWLNTQEDRGPRSGRAPSAWLANLKALYSPRAPGNTCLSALGSGRWGTPEKPINTSKGCGGVMRVAPVGLYFCDRAPDVRAVSRLGAETAALTHGHALGWLPAAALAQILHALAQDDMPLPDAVRLAFRTMEALWPDIPERRALEDLIRRAMDLAAGSSRDREAIEALGEGWVAEETLAIAVFCALRHAGDMEGALAASVNHGGDSDSTGAVTGNLLGAQLGLSGIPEKFTAQLELLELVTELADDLWQGCPDRESPAAALWSVKYDQAIYAGGETHG